ncbi:Leucine zipper transcription factor-like protein 1 [Chytriomyces hyalinus]|nr:Leucine zipper transcription factor-like protein 1 [Chytriomyces hyalinus]
MNQEDELKKYLGFMRKQRADSIKELKLTLKEVAERRVVETTYNCDDVRDILHDATVNCEATFQSEVMLHSHMNMLLIQQYIAQASKQNVALKGDIRELEDRKRLAEAALFEESLFSSTGHIPELNMKPDPVEVGPSPTETKLKSRIEELEKALLQLKLSTASQKLQTKLDETESNNKALLRLTERVRALESELDDRIDKSTPVQNLKKMILQKNDLLKEYRTRLIQLDPGFADSVK